MKFRFTIGKKIGTGFGVLIVLTVVAFIQTKITLTDSREKTEQVTELYIPSVTELRELNQKLLQSKLLITNWVNASTPKDESEVPEKQQLRRIITVEYPSSKKKIQKLSEQWGEEEKASLNSIFDDFDKLFGMHLDIMDNMLNSFTSYDDKAVLLMAQGSVNEDDIHQLTEKIKGDLANLIGIQQNNAQKVNEQMIVSFETLQSVVQGFGYALVIGGIVIAFFTVRTIVKPVQQLKKMLLSLGKGVLPAERIQPRKDEIGEMAVAMHGLIEGMSSTIDFAKQVGSGNFESDYKPLSDEDTLGKELLKMRTDLAENERVLEAKVIERTEEVVRQKEEITHKNREMEVLYTHVTDSIKYAKRIQEAILPPDKQIKQLLPNSFVLYKPKDIVSGDFYWMKEKDGKSLFAAVDCTGHGVPGAFMSIVGYNLLEHVITTTSSAEPAAILDALNKGVTETLHQSQDASSTRDGMDISICSLDYNTNQLQYAGAYNPLFLIRNGELQEINADKFPIGSYVSKANKFTNNKVQLQKGDHIYICSDGYADQFGGPKGKKFMIKRFRELLLKICPLPVAEQKNVLNTTIEEWRGNHEQVDDILIIGLGIV